MDLFAAFGSGVLAGIGLAAPLGAIGVLLVREGLAHGFARASPAAFAVSFVDACYCTLAVAIGAVAAPLIASWGALPAVIGGLVLVVLGVVGFWRTIAATPPRDGGAPPMPPGSVWRRFSLFLALTAINPATLVYFAALTIGLGGLLTSPTGAVAFVLGVALASLGWQLGLVYVGSALRGRVTPRAQRALSVGGYSIIVSMGLAAIVVAALASCSTQTPT